jgi:hypothetical protein
MPINRKHILKSLAIILTVFIVYVLYTQYERKFLRKFADHVVNEEIFYDDIIHNQLLCDEKSKETTKFFLSFYRQNYKKDTNFIYVLSNNEVLFFSEIFGFDYNLVQEDNGLIYFIFINGNTFPVLINKENKIIAISTMQKGKNVYFIKM